MDADAFVWPEQHRDHRAGDRVQLMVAVYALEHQHQRRVPHAVELGEAHGSSPGMALSDGVHPLPAFLGADPAETLWNRDSDPAGHALLAEYAQQLGLWYTDAELESDDDELLDRQGALNEYLQAGLPAPVRAMHDDGTVERLFGHPIPITFSAQDSHVAAWELARAANPTDLYALFGPIQERYWSPG
jgi:hypothetical protein